jgi:hypothetical protein
MSTLKMPRSNWSTPKRGDDASELVGGQDPALDEHLAGTTPARTRFRDRRLHGLARGVAEVDHDVADEARRAPAALGRGEARDLLIGSRGGLGKRHCPSYRQLAAIVERAGGQLDARAAATAACP